MDVDVRIRRGAANDGLCLGALATQVFFDTYATDGITPALAREARDQYSAAAFTARLFDVDTTFILAERDGCLLGFGEVRLRRPCPSTDIDASVELVRLYVQPQAQRSGLGRSLLGEAEQAAYAAGAVAVWLTTWAGNVGAKAFYRALGYRCVGTTQHVIESQAYANTVMVSAPLQGASPPSAHDPEIAPAPMGETFAAPLGGVSVAQFLRDYWQREPLLVRNAIPADRFTLPGEELAGLACEEEVESRLVIRDTVGTRWQLEHGPFSVERFAELPDRDWTLLVQAVDQWLPEIAAYLEHFDYLPRWRLDDVMVSYAVDGGGVGAHFDYYDVFLVQAAGRRRWEVGASCDADELLVEHADLRLLESFDALHEHVLEPGDMLYLPAGVSHRGTAVGDGCMTYSVGFRAPAHAELLAYAVQTLAEELPESARYRDPVGAADADPWRIGAETTASLSGAWHALAPADIDVALARALGSLVTEPRYPDLVVPERVPDACALHSAADTRGALLFAHHSASRFAYREVDDGAELFVDGECHRTTLEVARGLCHGELPAGLLEQVEIERLVLTLLDAGSLRLDD